MIYQLLLLLSVYGQEVPDLQPAFYNYFQPHAQYTNFQFDNLSNPDTSGFTFYWTVDSTTYQVDELPLNWLLPMDCHGVMPITLRAYHDTFQVTYERTMCSWVIWSYYYDEYPLCEEVPCTFVDVLNEPLTPEFTPYYYRIDCGLDADCNSLINANDILALLAQ